MRAFLPQYDLYTPKLLQEALEMLEESPGTWVPLAGGTDLMVRFADGMLPRGKYINIWGISELKGIRDEGEEISIGALTTFTELCEHALIQKHLPLLGQAAKEVGARAIQNRGTLGGNIMNASPAADTPPVLIAYNARVECRSLEEKRSVNIDEFYIGYKETRCRKEELLTRIIIPKPKKGISGYFKKVGPRKAMVISKVVFAGTMEREKSFITQIRLGLGSVAPTVLRLRRTEESLLQKKITNDVIQVAKESLFQEVVPIDDIRSSAEYRRVVAGNLLEEFLKFQLKR